MRRDREGLLVNRSSHSLSMDCTMIKMLPDPADLMKNSFHQTPRIAAMALKVKRPMKNVEFEIHTYVRTVRR